VEKYDIIDCADSYYCARDVSKITVKPQRLRGQTN
jgi:hypothetical protein